MIDFYCYKHINDLTAINDFLIRLLIKNSTVNNNKIKIVILNNFNESPEKMFYLIMKELK